MPRDKYKALTAKGAGAYFAMLENIGWFDIQQNDKDVVKKKLELEEDQTKLVFAIPHLFIDIEGFDDPEDYVSLLHEILPDASLHVIVTAKPGKKNIVSIDVRYKDVIDSYDLNLKKANGWLNQDFVEGFVNERILKGTGNQFFALPPEDQSIPFVFIPQELYKAAKREGIIPGRMGYFMEEES